MGERQKTLAINLVQLLPEASGGIETYARELIPLIVAELPEWTVRVHVNREGFDSYRWWSDACEWELSDFSWFDRFSRLRAESTSLPRAIRAQKTDLVHNMVNTACRKPGCPQLTTVFDATQILHKDPGFNPGAAIFRQLLKLAPKWSDATVTISHSAAHDIAEAFGLPESTVEVVHLAARTPSAVDPVTATGVRDRLGLGGDSPYFIAPLARRSNKNIDRLILAFADFATGRQVDHKLVLTGARGSADSALLERAEALGVGGQIVLTGWVTDAELDSLYEGALALVFPSIAEGFGLPILEAMQAGCPVATSDRSSMPEVGGDAALYFDPWSTESISQRMRELADDPELRRRCSKKGLARAKTFNWQRAARETVAIYRTMLGASAPG